jgi:hypothetical protein
MLVALIAFHLLMHIESSDMLKRSNEKLIAQTSYAIYKLR